VFFFLWVQRRTSITISIEMHKTNSLGNNEY